MNVLQNRRRAGTRGAAKMGNSKGSPWVKEKERQRTCLFGCLAIVGVPVILCTVGAYIVYTEARRPAHLLERFGIDHEVILLDGYTEEQVYRQLEGFINGVIDGTVRPQEGIIFFFDYFSIWPTVS